MNRYNKWAHYIYRWSVYCRRRRSETSSDTSLGLHEFHRSVTRRLVVHEGGDEEGGGGGAGREIRGALVLMTATVLALGRARGSGTLLGFNPSAVFRRCFFFLLLLVIYIFFMQWPWNIRFSGQQRQHLSRLRRRRWWASPYNNNNKNQFYCIPNKPVTKILYSYFLSLRLTTYTHSLRVDWNEKKTHPFSKKKNFIHDRFARRR